MSVTEIFLQKSAARFEINYLAANLAIGQKDYDAALKFLGSILDDVDGGVTPTDWPKKAILKNINWIRELDEPNLEARIRYRGEKLKVKSLKFKAGEWEVEFEIPIRGLSLGQSIVFYDREECLGGAVMDKMV